VYMLAFMMSYLAGLLRGVTSLEQNGMDTAALAMFQFLGVLLLAADGIPNWDRLQGVLRVLVWCSGFMAFTGILQAVLKMDITQYYLVPGLQLKSGLAGLEGRGDVGQFRVAATAAHFIEFSALMAMIVPYAIHFARFGKEKRHRIWAAVVAALAAASIPFTISRTGMLGLAIGILVMMPTWGWRLRYNLMVVGAVLT